MTCAAGKSPCRTGRGATVSPASVVGVDAERRLAHLANVGRVEGERGIGMVGLRDVTRPALVDRAPIALGGL